MFENESQPTGSKSSGKLEQERSDWGNLPKITDFDGIFSSILHEFNQPISGISNYSFAASHLLNRSQLTATDQAELKDWISQISSQTQQVAQMVQRLRTLVRANSAGQVLSLEQVVIEAMQKITRSIEITHLDRPVTVVGDRSQLEQVVLSLINILCPTDDAVESNNRQPTIAVQLVNKVAVLTISNCLLIEANAVKEHQFELAVCRWLILLHGGSFEHESLDDATCYRVFLPTCDATCKT